MEHLIQDPLDRTLLPTSNNWIPNLKTPSLGHIGKPLHKPTITKKRFLVRLKGRRRPIDVVAQRQLARTRLLNAKARHYDELIKDAIELNDVEQRYLIRKAELERLEAKFKAGVLSFFTEGVVKKAETNLIEDVVKNDPDIATFDQKTSEIIESGEQLANLQEQNEEDRQELRENISELDELLEFMITNVETASEMEAITEMVEQRNMLPLEGITEQEETDIEGDISGEEDIEEEDLENYISKELEEEELKAAAYEEVADKAEELREEALKKKPVTPKPKTLEEAKSLLDDIEAIVARLTEKQKGMPLADRRLRNLVNRVTLDRPRNLRRVHERNPRPSALRRFRSNLIDALKKARATQQPVLETRQGRPTTPTKTQGEPKTPPTLTR